MPDCLALYSSAALLVVESRLCNSSKSRSSSRDRLLHIRLIRWTNLVSLISPKSTLTGASYHSFPAIFDVVLFKLESSAVE